MSEALKFTATKDGGFADYIAERDGVRYEICRTTDRGFGLVARKGDSTVIPEKGWDIAWMRTKSACVAYANKFAAERSAT